MARVRTTAALLVALVSGCAPVTRPAGPSPTTSVSNRPVLNISARPTLIVPSTDPARGLPPANALRRSDATRGAENPSAPPSDIAALADRAGGPAGGFIVGAIPSVLQGNAMDRAQRANDQAEQRPAQVSSVLARAVADLNGDGFITLDEITAMKRAGLAESLFLDRLQQSQAVFCATRRQQQYLRDRGVPEAVVKFVAGAGTATR